MSDIRLDIDGSARHLAHRRRNARVLLVTAAVLALAAFSLPWVASSGWGNARVLALLNDRIRGSVSVDRAEIGWLGGARVSGLLLRDPEGLPVVSGVEAEADGLGLLDLAAAWARGRWPAADVGVRVESLRLRRSGDGRLNLARSLAAPAGSPMDSETAGAAGGVGVGGSGPGWRERIGWTGSGVATPPALRLRASITRGGWQPAAGSETTTFDEIEATLDLRDGDRLRLELGGRTLRDGVAGRVNADIVLLHGQEPGGGIGWREAAVEADIEASSLPVALLEEIVGSRGRVEAAVGPTLGARIRARGTLAVPEGVLEVQADRLNGSVRLERDGGDVRVAEGGHLHWTLTPEAFAAMAPPADDASGGWELKAPVALRLAVERLRLSEGAAGAQPEWAAFRLAGDADDAVLERGDERLALLGGRVVLESEAIGRRVELLLAGRADTRGVAGVQPARIRFSLLNARMPAGAGPPSLEVEAVGVPTGLLSLAGPAGLRVADALGPTLGLSLLAVQEEPAGRLRLRPDVLGVEIDITSEGVSGPVRLRLAEGGRSGSISTPEPMRLRLKPAAALKLLPRIAAIGVTLEAPVATRLDLRELRWRSLPAAAAVLPGASRREAVLAWVSGLDPDLSGIGFGLTAEHARLRGPGGGLVDLADLKLEAAADRLTGQPRLFAETRVLPADGGTTVLEAGSVRVDGRITGLVDDQRRVRPGGADYGLKLVGDALPVATLDRVLGFGYRLPPLLGPVLAPTLALEAAPDHPLRVRAGFESARAVVGLGAEWIGDELVLTPDGRLQIAIDEAGADAVRGRLHPLTWDLVRGVAGEPLVLSPAAGARLRPGVGWTGWLPLFDGAEVAAGGLELRSDGWLLGGTERSVRQVATGEARLRGHTTVLRASPLTISLEGGQLRHGPLWLVGEGISLALRGTADAGPVREDRPAVAASALEMTLALPGATVLRLAPGAAGGVSPIALYELPVTGWIGNPQVETERFATDLLLAVGDARVAGAADAAGGGVMSRWLGGLSEWSPPPAARLLIAETAEARRPLGANISDASPLRSVN